MSVRRSRLLNGIDSHEGSLVVLLDLLGFLHQREEIGGTAKDDDELGLFDRLVVTLDFDVLHDGLLQGGVSEPSL